MDYFIDFKISIKQEIKHLNLITVTLRDIAGISYHFKFSCN